MTPLLRIKEKIVGPRGLYDIDNEWYGFVDEFKFTIGLPGLMGFGVGCCRPELLPDDMAPLPGCWDRWSPNYGTYIHVPSASIMCFLPAHHIDIQSPGNTDAPFFGSKVVITDGQVGDSVLARPFRDGGEDLAGVFIDKYQICNVRPDGSGLPNTTSGNPGDPMLTGGIGASRPLQWPCSMGGNSSAVSGIDALTSKALNANAPNPSANVGGAFAAAQTRGVAFNAIPIWTRAQLAYLSLAHAQALLDNSGNPIAGATDNAAWMDVAPYAPKGNNNVGSDFNKTTLQFARPDIVGTTSTATSGFAGQSARAYTGAARIGSNPAVAHTTHNGQPSGVVDVCGNQWDCVPGLSGGGAQFNMKVWPESLSWNLCTSNGGVLANGETLAVDTGDNGIYWGGGSVALIANSGGTFHPNSSWTGQPTRRIMTQCMLPRSAGTGTQTSTNHFGGDVFSRSLVNDVLPFAGGHWSAGASAGVFALDLYGVSTTSAGVIGCRAVRLLAA